MAELTVGRLLTSWQPDVPALLLVMVLGGLYGWGVLRVRAKGEPWSPVRTAAFTALGLGALVVATMSALAVYDHVLFWPAAVQNILLDLVAPLGVKTTRLAHGVPVGGELDYLDEGTLAAAIRSRTDF